MLARLKTSLIVLATLFALLFFTICFHQREVLEATSILGKSIRQIEPEKKVTKLLILAYPRTGSSFVGDILSAHPNSSYLFEPLYEYFPYGYSVDYWPTWNSTVRDIVEEYMEKLFNCDEVSTIFRLFLDIFHVFYYRCQ